MFSTMSTKHDEFLKINSTVSNQINFDNADSPNDILTENSSLKDNLQNKMTANPIRLTKKKRGLESKFDELFIQNCFSFIKDDFAKKLIIKFLLFLQKAEKEEKFKCTAK
jgi:hypothetical protein